MRPRIAATSAARGTRRMIHVIFLLSALDLAVSFSTVQRIAHRTSSNRQRRRQDRRPLNLSPEPLTSAIDSFFQTQPYIAAFLTCSVKAGTADFVAQAQPQLLSSSDASDNAEEDDWEATDDDDDDKNLLQARSNTDTVDPEKSLDLARNVAFIVYGGIYQGLFQEFLYGTLFPVWFGNDGSLQTVATSVLADQFVFAPFTCLPCAYIIKAFVMGSGDDDENENVSDATVLSKDKAETSNNQWSDTAMMGLAKYKEDVLQRGLLFKYWAIWFPVQTITFSVIPERYRILFIACVSFFWMFLLSAISSDTTSTTEKIVVDEAAVSTAADEHVAVELESTPFS